MKFCLAFGVVVCVGLFYGCDGLTCAATVGQTCTGATYCQAQWILVGGQYQRIYAVCIQSSYPMETGWKFTSQNALEFTCNFVDLCNNFSPPIPNPPPPTLPPPISCIKRTGTGAATQCPATVCKVSRSPTNGQTQSCDNSNTVTKKLSLAPHSFCTFTSAPTSMYTCYCNNEQNCNTNNMMDQGMINLINRASLTCYSGSPAKQNTVKAQFCTNTTSVTSGQTTVQLTAAATTYYTTPTMGCEKVYGYSNNTWIRTCYCNSNLCNFAPPPTTTGYLTMPHTFPTFPQGSPSVVSHKSLIMIAVSTVLLTLTF